MSEAITFNLKVVINKQKTKVLFVEVDNDFVNVLFSFLILPLGNIAHAMEKHYGDKKPHVIGSLDSLYNGISDLDGHQFQLFSYKPSLLKPESAYLFPFQKRRPTFAQSNVCRLGEAYFVVLKVFTEENASFIICDDLRIVPNGNESIVQTLNCVGIGMSDIDGVETRCVTFGPKKMMDFLRGLMISRQPLTDIILGGCTAAKSETGIPLHHMVKKEATSESTTMYNLKVMLQKSTKKLLFAQTNKDFVSLLCTMLTYPLGLVDTHLGGHTCLDKTRNLYRSIIDLVDHKYLIRADAKDSLMKLETFSHSALQEIVTDVLNAKGSRMYMVTDDLQVTLLSVSSTISLLNQKKISSSDVEEVDFYIGLEEGLNILKASLVSTCALSNGLFNPTLKTQRMPKRKNVDCDL